MAKYKTIFDDILNNANLKNLLNLLPHYLNKYVIIKQRIDKGNNMNNLLNQIKDIVDTSIKTHLIPVNKRLDNIESDVKDLKVRVTNLETDMKEVKSDVKDLKVRVTNLEDNVEHINTRLDKIVKKNNLKE